MPYTHSAWLLTFALLAFLLAPSSAAPITIDTVVIGNPHNAPDPEFYSQNNFDNSHFGTVTKVYRIGQYEVTNEQYAAFLNAKAKSDNKGLYNPDMGTEGRGGITRLGASGNYSYEVRPDMGNKPVVYVGWFDAMRFTNWLHNGQGDGDTESGAYLLLGGTAFPTNRKTVHRELNARWFLPSENEWYKAAYHQPADQGGDTDSYWLYATSTNTAPVESNAIDTIGPTRGDVSNPGFNRATYGNGSNWNGVARNITSVGTAGPASASYYGTYDQAGNTAEWTETYFVFGSGNQSFNIRGGSWGASAFSISAANRALISEFDSEGSTTGFRVAADFLVPEPGSLALAHFASLGGVFLARRRGRWRVSEVCREQPVRSA